MTPIPKRITNRQRIFKRNNKKTAKELSSFSTSRGAAHLAAVRQRKMNSAQITELMWKSISEASTVLQKGLAFYLAILAGTTGYLFSANLTDENKLIVFYAILSISFFTVIAAAALGWGIWIGLDEITKTATSVQDEFAHQTFEMFVKRGRNVGIILIGCLFCALLTVFTSLVIAML